MRLLGKSIKSVLCRVRLTKKVKELVHVKLGRQHFKGTPGELNVMSLSRPILFFFPEVLLGYMFFLEQM